MEIAGFILLMLGVVLLLAFSLSADLAAFVSGNTPLIIGASMVIAGLVLLYLCEPKRKKTKIAAHEIPRYDTCDDRDSRLSGDAPEREFS